MVESCIIQPVRGAVSHKMPGGSWVAVRGRLESCPSPPRTLCVTCPAPKSVRRAPTDATASAPSSRKARGRRAFRGGCKVLVRLGVWRYSLLAARSWWLRGSPPLDWVRGPDALELSGRLAGHESESARVRGSPGSLRQGVLGEGVRRGSCCCRLPAGGVRGPQRRSPGQRCFECVGVSRAWWLPSG